jgi:tight adherence protein B
MRLMLPEHVAWMSAAFIAAVSGFVALVNLSVRLARSHRDRFEAAVGRSLRDAFLFVDPGSLRRLNLLLAVSASAIAFLISASVVASLIVAIASAAVPRGLIVRLRRRHLEAFRRQMPDLLMMLSGSLRAGNGLSQAMAGLVAGIGAPARQELGLVLREQRLGASLADSLAGLQRRLRIEETMLFACALRIGTESGGNLADALETLAESTRRKLALEEKIAALTAQGRLQAWVMGLLPAGIAMLLGVFDPEYEHALVFLTQHPGQSPQLAFRGDGGRHGDAAETAVVG